MEASSAWRSNGRQAWVSRTDTDVPFYRMNNLDPNGRLGILIRYYDATNNVISTSSLLEPAGHVIEGWQKIEKAAKTAGKTM